MNERPIEILLGGFFMVCVVGAGQGSCESQVFVRAPGLVDAHEFLLCRKPRKTNEKFLFNGLADWPIDLVVAAVPHRLQTFGGLCVTIPQVFRIGARDDRYTCEWPPQHAADDGMPGFATACRSWRGAPFVSLLHIAFTFQYVRRPPGPGHNRDPARRPKGFTFHTRGSAFRFSAASPAAATDTFRQACCRAPPVAAQHRRSSKTTTAAGNAPSERRSVPPSEPVDCCHFRFSTRYTPRAM